MLGCWGGLVWMVWSGGRIKIEVWIGMSGWLADYRSWVALNVWGLR